MSEFVLPKSPPPRFALENHEWMPIQCTYFKDEIRVLGQWRLVRKIKFVPTADVAKRNLKRPPETKSFTAHLKLSSTALNSVRLTKVMGDLADIVERGLAEKQEAKKPTSKAPRYLRAKPGASMGEIRDAAGLLQYLVSFGCVRLMKIAEKNPEILRSIARQKISWPMMMSRHPGYKVNHLAFLESLEQGDAAIFDVNQSSRNGTQKAPIEKGTREIAQNLYRCLLSEWTQTRGRLDGKTVRQFCDDDQISSIWWEVARARLLEAYPKPHEIPELARITTAPSRKYPAQKSADILRRLEAAFLGFAKNQEELAKLG